MINCKDIKEKLADYCYGELDAGGQKEFEAHLNGCPDCAKELSETIKVLAAADSNKAPEMSAAFWNKFIAETKEKAASRKAGSYGIWKISVAIGLAAMLVLAVLPKKQAKITDLDAIYMLSEASISSSTGEISDLEIEMLTDLEFVDETSLEIGS